MNRCALTFLVVSLASLCTAGSHASGCAGVRALSPDCSSHETPYRRDFFYFGGRTVQNENGTFIWDAVYVEKLSPIASKRQKSPLVFFHGGGTSGVSWLNTPDNRKGWASYFVEKGYHVYLVDAYAGARSPANNFNEFRMNPGQSAEWTIRGFTKSTDKHTQFPGSKINDGDPSFDAFWKTMIPWTVSFVPQETAMRRAGCELLSILSTPSFLIGHSLGSYYPLLLSNDCPQFVAGSINLEPATIPFWRPNIAQLGGVPQNPWGLTFSPLSYDPPINNASQLVTETVGDDTLERRICYQQVEPARQLPNISSVPYLGLSSEGSLHKTYYHCIQDYLKQVGGDPEWIKLEDIGIKGNGHFMHLELNNIVIAGLVEDWILKTRRNALP